MTSPAELPIDSIFLRDDPELAVAQVGLGLTVYLDDPVLWAQEGAAAMLRAFLDIAPRDRLGWYTTSMLADWHPVEPDGLEKLVEVLSTPSLERRVRHHFSFQLADNVGAAETSFWYHEVDSSRDGRAGFLQLLLPQDHDPGDVVQLALEIGHRWPFWSGIGGHVATYWQGEKPSALWFIHDWCRRYLGLDVQDPEAMSWVAPTGLPGASWLTMIGAPLAKAKRLNLAKLAKTRFDSPITVLEVAGGALVRAGDRPTTGDKNALVYPAAYAEVTRRLEDQLVKEVPELWGELWKKKDTRKWFRRLLTPAEWR